MDSLSPYTIAMVIVFIIGYAMITAEHFTKINKATVAIMMGVIVWVLQFATESCPGKNGLPCLIGHLASVAQIIFFLMGALVIVEVIDKHRGFKLISEHIHVASKKKFLWVIGFITFFLSSILDNLTTTIVMISLLERLFHRTEDRLIIGGGVVIAANAGGVWTPIGDVTTTMLWIGGQLTTYTMMRDLFLPSFVTLIVSLAALSLLLKGEFVKKNHIIDDNDIAPHGKLVFFLGIGALVFVPIFKLLTGLPPFMGILFGLSVLWFVTDILHGDHKETEHLKVPAAFSKIDFSSVIFFLGILLCIDALDSALILEHLAKWLDATVGNVNIIAITIGLASAVVDNVPLVAASMGMYDVVQHPVDASFWKMIAYCAGTGGSILVIGSAAGVVYMGLEKVDFFWYLRRISLPALLGYFAGIATYLLLGN